MVRHKYGVAAASERVYNGILYHSKREKTYAATLDNLKTARNIKDRVVSWDRQVRLPLVVDGTLIGHYVADFAVRYADGREVLVEVKGFETPGWKLKHKLFKALYPGKALEVVK